MLNEFLSENKVKAKIHVFKKPMTSVAETTKQLNISPNQIAKSILFMADDEPVLVVLLGIQRVSEQKVKEAIGCFKLDLATEEQVFEMTGFEVGGVPPIGIYGVKTLIQKEVADAKQLWCGGGDELSLLEIAGEQIVEFANDPVIADMAE